MTHTKSSAAPPGIVPHLDTSLVENLGIIEVVVLRCISTSSLQPPSATDVGPYPEPRSIGALTAKNLLASTTPKAKHLGNTGETKQKVAPKPATVKTATPTPSENFDGIGMPGMFDGASDEPWGLPANTGAENKGWGNMGESEPQQKAPQENAKSKSRSRPLQADGDGWKPDKGRDIQYEEVVKQRRAKERAFNNKSRSSRAAPHLMHPAQHGPKAYWASWDPKSKGYGNNSGHETGGEQGTKQFVPRDPYTFPAYDQPQIYGEFAASRGLHIQATTGKGARYVHPRARPRYIDSMEAPYAVFTFRYRSRAYFAPTRQSSMTGMTTSRSRKTSLPPSIKSQSLQKTVDAWDDGHKERTKDTVHNVSKLPKQDEHKSAAKKEKQLSGDQRKGDTRKAGEISKSKKGDAAIDSGGAADVADATNDAAGWAGFTGAAEAADDAKIDTGWGGKAASAKENEGWGNQGAGGAAWEGDKSKASKAASVNKGAWDSDKKVADGNVQW